MEHKVDRIEFDVRVTKDGVPILHHDRRLTDPNGQKHWIKQTAYRELKARKPDLATLAEALDAANKYPLYIEVKSAEVTKPIVQILEARRGDWWLGSKSQKTLVELHQALPRIPKIVIEPWSGVRARHRAKQLNTDMLSMYSRGLWWGFIKAVSKNYKLYSYTVNDPKKAARWAKAGLVGVVTDYPDRFKK